MYNEDNQYYTILYNEYSDPESTPDATISPNLTLPKLILVKIPDSVRYKAS